MKYKANQTLKKNKLKKNLQIRKNIILQKSFNKLYLTFIKILETRNQSSKRGVTEKPYE